MTTQTTLPTAPVVDPANLPQVAALSVAIPMPETDCYLLRLWWFFKEGDRRQSVREQREQEERRAVLQNPPSSSLTNEDIR